MRRLLALWTIYTLLLSYGMTIAPTSVLKEVNDLFPMSFDPSASLRHFLLFIIEGFLSAKLMEWDGVAFSAALGGSLELSQYFIPYRTFDLFDLLANVLGSLVGGLAALRH